MKQEPAEGEDYYFNEEGFVVFTEAFLLRRGTCCGNGCRHCPYDYINVAEPERSELLTLRNSGKEKN